MFCCCIVWSQSNRRLRKHPPNTDVIAAASFMRRQKVVKAFQSPKNHQEQVVLHCYHSCLSESPLCNSTLTSHPFPKHTQKRSTFSVSIMSLDFLPPTLTYITSTSNLAFYLPLLLFISFLLLLPKTCICVP